MFRVLFQKNNIGKKSSGIVKIYDQIELLRVSRNSWLITVVKTLLGIVKNIEKYHFTFSLCFSQTLSRLLILAAFGSYLFMKWKPFRRKIPKLILTADPPRAKVK